MCHRLQVDQFDKQCVVSVPCQVNWNAMVTFTQQVSVPVKAQWRKKLRRW